MPKPIAFINHQTYNYPGHLAQLFEDMGYRWTMLFREDLTRRKVNPGKYAALVSLGSWSSPDPTVPEVRAELDLIARAVQHKIPVVGVCFGGELLALHDGGRVFPLTKPMIGYFSFQLKGSPFKTSKHFFWNSLGFSAPAKAAVLATGPDSCFAYQTEYTLALQFHIDATAELLRQWTSSPIGAQKLQKAGISPIRIIDEATWHTPAIKQDIAQLLQTFIAR